MTKFLIKYDKGNVHKEVTLTVKYNCTVDNGLAEEKALSKYVCNYFDKLISNLHITNLETYDSIDYNKLTGRI
tara:strand:+ start:3592 stop:3810 length:219 start_codon:yes stop_codon:yes gene_type:complete